MIKSIFALLISCSSLIAYAQQSNLQPTERQQKDQAQKELTQLQSNIKKLQTTLSSKRTQQSSALKKLRSSEKRIATASKILKSTTGQLKKKERELKLLRSKQKTLEVDKLKQKNALAEQLRSAYMNGQQEYLKLLLNQQNPDELGRTLVYYDYMNKARGKQVRALQETLAELKIIDLSIQSEIQKLNILKQAKQSETKQLTSLKNKRQKLVNQLSKEIASKSDELTELEINAQELQQLIDSVRETIEEMDFSQPLEGLKKIKGKLKWPTNGKRLRNYGSVNNGQRSNGVLISGSEGKEISAVHHGRVVYADWLRGFGLLLIVDHGKGYMSLYGYNQALYKEVGDWVEAREAIATLGQSGGQNRPALYFELRHQGKPINPRRWFRR
ncbi:MAG: peptidoglycan DD-metalloendopeptidase family protein [Kangiellaceae bacterium]|nr:peptidoglycan DD-metalloendopeptidase family protein [Kangiellaceae bacterium]